MESAAHYANHAPSVRLVRVIRGDFQTPFVSGLRVVILLLTIFLCAPRLYSYSVLTHESIIDSVWNESLAKLLRQRFPKATAEDLKKARAFAYGGAIIQDMKSDPG